MKEIKFSRAKPLLWKLGLTLPWSNAAKTTQIDNQYVPTNSRFPTDTFVVAEAINLIAQVALYVGGALMFFWAVWGVFDYIKGEGNKEALAKARKKIQWAIVGFVILILTFFISDYLQPILLQGRNSGDRILVPLTQ